ncbi:PREDICTED: uncharacterized protein LOC104600207 isoform X2 [Nelumbo nucifera]|uniref:Uncharacterized protein LOC104600207 isoform X2 n=1 Tax=Nelumbo nucifera TaxID=4432 RepID=A0A1U8AG11_NELNU|nr:PREDICTED: uncharacterized protein LOC104600207 isoform X2 [Nelumbo nucifera]
MSSEGEHQSLPPQPIQIEKKSQMSKISYTRDFLLSLSELDICKKLPSGFDSSILSEFEDAPHSVLERQRIPGSFPLQSFRRGEYGSSPPSRGDSTSYSRGSHGRWDTRSSGSNDKDGDSQSDRDSDSGRRYVAQSRRSWQNNEHDGLLGSGAFPRPSGYTSGPSGPKVRGNAHYQLNKSSEPYHPPRPYKAVPHSRKDITDSFNDETFGSTECSSQDRAEEERRRRASFELMRKEQQKALQEKQKQVTDRHKENLDPDIAALLEDSEDNKGVWNKKNGSEELVVLLASESDSVRSSFATQTPASRPLVPPGFTSTILEKNLGTKLITPPTPEVENVAFEGNIIHSSNLLANGDSEKLKEKKSLKHMDSSEQEPESKTIQVPFMEESEEIVIPLSSQEVSGSSFGATNPSCKTSNLSEVCERKMDGEVADVDAEKVTGHDVSGTTGQDNSTSILDKLFGSALTVNSGVSSSLIEQNDMKADDTWNPISFQSSKFAHWFLEEEKKPVDDLSSGKPRDLLSLIVNSEKDGQKLSEVSDEKATEHAFPLFPVESNELTHGFITSTATSATVGTSEAYHYNKPAATPGVLTCEDLEQSILSEINETSPSLQHPAQSWNVLDEKAEQPRADVDDRASQHLLSLLQKGASQKDPAPSPNLDIGLFDKPSAYGSVNPLINSSSEDNVDKMQSSEKTLTLETLFGTAFMKELHSVEAPVSVQRGSLGGATRSDFQESQALPFPVTDDGFFSSKVDEYGSKTAYEGNVLASNHILPTKSDKIGGHWLRSDDHQMQVRSKINAVGGFEDKADGVMDIKLPEEESLITVGDPINPSNSTFIPAFQSTKPELLSSSSTPFDIAEKLAALNTVAKDERSMVPGLEGPSFLCGPYEPVESDIPYPNLHGQPSSPQFNPQMTHGRPLFHSLESHGHMNPQVKFMGPESIIHHEPPSHHFPTNIFHAPPFQHAPPGPTRLDPSTHHAMLQQMHMPGNFPPPHLLHGLPRGAPMPQHINQMAGYMPELNPMQGFPLSHRQHYGGIGMPIPASGGVGEGNHPEAFERLIEMELRANAKQMNPISTAGHNLGMYNHELDMGFRFR